MNIALQATYDRIAVDWERHHSVDEWWIPGTDSFLSYIPPNGTLLDVGCGAGVKAKYAAERGYNVLGTDFSQGQLALARSSVPSARFEKLSMEELDTFTETFDGVFAQASLLHIPRNDAGEMIKKMARRLNPGGPLYVAVKEVKQVEEEVKKDDDLGYEYERFFSYYRMPELEDFFQKAGLKVFWKEAKPSGRTVWLQIIGRK